MIGLVVLVAAIVYLALVVWVTRAAYRWAKAKGLSKGRCWLAAAGGFLLINLPVFWDWIPTIAANRYYCATEAGFKVFKTLDQWKAENPGVAEQLTWKDMSAHEVLPDGTRRYLLNERMAWVIRKSEPIPLLSTTLFEDSITDYKTGQVLAKRLGVGSGYPNPIVGGSDWRGFKSWLDVGGCSPMLMEFSEFQTAAKKMGEKK